MAQKEEMGNTVCARIIREMWGFNTKYNCNYFTDAPPGEIDFSSRLLVNHMLNENEHNF